MVIDDLATMDRIPVYILAGGHARRFGSDKARAPLAGRPLLLHVAEALQPRASAMTVVAERADKYSDLGLRTIADSERLGPLDGLLAAIADLPGSDDWLLLASCDLHGVRAEWLDALGAASDAAGTQVAAFRTERWEPLPALYHRSVAPVARELLEGDQRSLWRLLDRVNASPVALPAGWQATTNVNTIDALQALDRSEVPPVNVDK